MGGVLLITIAATVVVYAWLLALLSYGNMLSRYIFLLLGKAAAIAQYCCALRNVAIEEPVFINDVLYICLGLRLGLRTCSSSILPRAMVQICVELMVRTSLVIPNSMTLGCLSQSVCNLRDTSSFIYARGSMYSSSNVATATKHS